MLTKPGAAVEDDDMPSSSPRHSHSSSTRLSPNNSARHPDNGGDARGLERQTTRFMSARNHFSAGLTLPSASAALPNTLSNASASAFDASEEPWLAYGGSAALGDSHAPSEADDEMASCSSGQGEDDTERDGADNSDGADLLGSDGTDADAADAESEATRTSSVGRYMSLDTSGGEREWGPRRTREDAGGGVLGLAGSVPAWGDAEPYTGNTEPSRGPSAEGGSVAAVVDDKTAEEDDYDDADEFADEFAEARFVYSPYSPM